MAIKFYYHDSDFRKNSLLFVKCHPLTQTEMDDIAADLDTDDEGLVVYNKTFDRIYAWDGTQFISANTGSIDWNDIINTPTTISGYGITDVYTKTELQTSGQSQVHWGNITNVPTFSITLASLTDVSLTSLQNNQLLKYNSTSSKWENWTPNYVPETRSITATGDGITGGGDLSADRTFSLDFTYLDSRYAAFGSGVTSFNGRTGAVTPQSGDYTTSIVAEGSNLYWTQTRFDTAFSAKTTDNLTEGSTNLYFTQSRVRQSLSAGTGISYNNSTGVISLNTTYTDGVYHKQGGNSYSADSVVGTNDNFGLIFRTNGTNKVKIHTNGNMSVGSTTDNGDKLHVTGTFKATGSTYDTFTDSSGAFSVNRISNGNAIYRAATNGDFSGRFDIYNGSNTVASRISGGTTDSYINGGGGLALGTTTANSYKLWVQGNIACTEYAIIGNSAGSYNAYYINGLSGNLGTVQRTSSNNFSLGWDTASGTGRLGTAVLTWNTSNRVMIGTTTDSGHTLNVNGPGRFTDSLKTTGLEVAVTTKTANYTALKTDFFIICNTTSGDITITLPTTGISTGQKYIIKKIVAANNVILDPNSTATIDGSANYSFSTQWQSMTVIFDGTNYLIV